MVMLKCCRELKHAVNDKNSKQNHVTMSQTCKIGHRKIQKKINKNYRKIWQQKSQKNRKIWVTMQTEKHKQTNTQIPSPHLKSTLSSMYKLKTTLKIKSEKEWRKTSLMFEWWWMRSCRGRRNQNRAKIGSGSILRWYWQDTVKDTVRHKTV